MKTAISIPDHIFEEAEQEARRLGMSRSELYTRAVDAFCQAQRAQNVTEKLNEVYEAEDGALDSVLARMQAASLPPDSW